MTESDGVFRASPARTDIGPSTRPDLWFGVVEWHVDDAGAEPLRLPAEDVFGDAHPSLIDAARKPTGVRLEGLTAGGLLELDLLVAPDTNAFVDITRDGTRVVHQKIDTHGPCLVTYRSPDEPGLTTIWLPQGSKIRVHGASLTGGKIDAAPARPRWMTYGSSITHCTGADGPSRTWPALVSTSLGVDLTSFGFSGQCRLDGEALDAMATRPADLISLCLGINCYGDGSYNRRTWAPQVRHFMRTLRRTHPGVPMVVMSPILGCHREQTPNPVGMTLADYRADVAQVTARQQELGDDLLTYVDGRDILGPADAHLLADRLHPTATGYRLMAERLTPVLRQALAEAPTAP
jgi:lysophospholipase L1-like esterase